MNRFRVHSYRGDVIETVHAVSVAVAETTASGGRRVRTFNPIDGPVIMRSAAKPFQAIPLYDGAVERYAITDREVALACASHNSEVAQVQIVREFLARLELEEDALVCGPHRPLIKDLGVISKNGSAEDPPLASRSRIASNCSGKHAGMLAVARAAEWPTLGYEQSAHPVQHGCRETIAEFCDVDAQSIGSATDGCGVVCWALPLEAMATGYLRLITSSDERARQVVSAMMRHPHLVAGERRLCTALMKSYPNQVVAKIGASGVYGAAFPDARMAIALKVHDGDSRAAGVALLSLIHQLDLLSDAPIVLDDHARPAILNTRLHPVGFYQSDGEVRLT